MFLAPLGSHAHLCVLSRRGEVPFHPGLHGYRRSRRPAPFLMAQGSPCCARGFGVRSGWGGGSVLPLPLRGCDVRCEQAALLTSRPHVHILWQQDLHTVPEFYPDTYLFGRPPGQYPWSCCHLGHRQSGWEDGLGGRSRGWSCSFRVSDCSQAACP